MASQREDQPNRSCVVQGGERIGDPDRVEWARVEWDRMEKHAMLKTIALMSLGAAISFTSLPAIAQTNQSTTPAASAPAASAPTGSHRSQMRHRANISRERARASAHHMRQMQQKPAATTP
jgi:hypothetical protein